MRDSDTLKSQLATEEASLAETTKQIEAAHRRIEALHARIAETQNQIAATERQIEELADHAATIEKRIELLREYMTMVAEAPEAPNAAPAAPAPAAPTRPTPPPGAITYPTPPPGVEIANTDAEPLPSLGDPEPEDEIGDLAFVESMPQASADDTNPPRTDKPDSFEDLDEETLTHELLPRTQTFEEELLLVMAFHRKAILPKDISRVFRRLDYAPKQKATEAAIKAQVEATPHFIEYAKEGRIALTAEGREEAQRLLQQLL
ncbi:MAG: hypothetical protein GTO46_07025 [Gemmatimonadetes bacterium]|nr:hypothetical protein [Gemmatimonadota bacterium]NIO31382.1 hypothetical protein [Gemmatimonadota bacterium]